MSEHSHLLIGSRSVLEVGNSMAISVPAEVLSAMGLGPGDQATLVYDREQKALHVEEGDGSSILEAGL